MEPMKVLLSVDSNQHTLSKETLKSIFVNNAKRNVIPVLRKIKKNILKKLKFQLF